MSLKNNISALWNQQTSGEISSENCTEEHIAILDEFLDSLESGSTKAAEKKSEEWEVNHWVKRGILLNFSLRKKNPIVYGDVVYNDILPLADTSTFSQRGTRNTPSATVIRRGAHIGSNAILMSPCFVNIGASIGDGTLVDSNDVVGSCAQVGANVKLGANAVVGGVLEPIESAPVIIEDDVSLGSGCRVTSGFVIGEGSIVAENTLLTPRIPVYDLVSEEIIYGHLPPNRRAFTRFVHSDVGNHPLFKGGVALKPAVVALDIEDSTRIAAEKEDRLRK
jgi:2,3,4,5-tetrahydropyridine-2-carboxylate N-succinyltransferase